MDFVRSYFGTNEPMYVKSQKWGKKCSTGQRFICTEVNNFLQNPYFKRQRTKGTLCTRLLEPPCLGGNSQLQDHF